MVEEVFSAEEANYTVVVSEAFGRKRIIQKCYYFVPDTEPASECLAHVAREYSYLFDAGTRIDLYKVRFGRVIGK